MASLLLIYKAKDTFEARGWNYLNDKYPEKSLEGFNPYSVKQLCNANSSVGDDILMNIKYYKRSHFKICKMKDVLESIGEGDADLDSRPISIITENLKDSECSMETLNKTEDNYISLIEAVNQRMSARKVDYSKLCHMVRKRLGDIYQTNKACR